MPQPMIVSLPYLLDPNTQSKADDYLISAIHMNSGPIDPETTRVQMQTVFKRKGSSPDEVPSRPADEVIVSPEPPINSPAKLIKTPISLGLESVCLLLRDTCKRVCIEIMVSNKVAILKVRAPNEINRHSLAFPSTFTHQLQFMRMAERRAVEPGDIILLYKTNAPQNAELVMALVISLAKEGTSRNGMFAWHGLMSLTHNKVQEIWETVNKPSSPQTYLKTQNVERVPIRTMRVVGDQNLARYINTPLNQLAMTDSLQQPASSSGAAPTLQQPTLSSGTAPTLQQPTAASSTFTFGAPPPDEQGAAKRARPMQ